METKLSKVTRCMETGNFVEALRIAARFPDLGPHREDIVRGHEAIAHPNFYRQLGKNPDELVTAGIAALRDRFGKFLHPATAPGQ